MIGLEELFNEFWLAYGGEVVTILLLIVVDILVGVLAALRDGAFEWERVGDFYQSKIIPYVGSYVLLALLFGFGDRDLIGLAGIGDEVLLAARAIIFVSLGGSIFGNLQVIGVPDAVENGLTAIGARPTPDA